MDIDNDKINYPAMESTNKCNPIISQATVPYCILGWRMKQQRAGDRPVMFSLLRHTINDYNPQNDTWSRDDQVSGRIEVDLVNKPLEIAIVFEQDKEKWPGLRLPQGAKKGDRWLFQFVESPKKVFRPKWKLLMRNSPLESIELECDSWAFPDDWAETYFDPVYPPKQDKDPLDYMYSGPIY